MYEDFFSCVCTAVGYGTYLENIFDILLGVLLRSRVLGVSFRYKYFMAKGEL